MINEIKCAYCKTIATSGVNTIELDEYYPVCDADLDRLVNDYKMVAVELITHYDCEYCGDNVPMDETHWGC